MKLNECMQKIKELEDQLKNKNEYITHLEKITEAYDIAEELAHQDLIEADKTIKAYDSLRDYMLNEQKDAYSTITAHENLQTLTNLEKTDAENLLHARESLNDLFVKELKKKDSTIRKILEINKHISSIPDQDFLLIKILEGLISSLNAKRGILYYNNGKKIIPKHYFNINKSEYKKSYFQIAISLIEDSIKTKQLHSKFNEKIFIDNHETQISMICVPFQFEQKFLGLIYVDIISDTETFNVRDIDISEIFSSQAAIAIENARVYQELDNMNKNLEIIIEKRTSELNEANKKLILAATTDMLTGAFNRQELQMKLINEKGRVDRMKDKIKTSFSVLFIDMDNFKFHNDSFQHQLGDLILKLFAEMIKELIRSIDIIARFGGDEFIIVLPDTHIKGAASLAERIYQVIKKKNHFKKEIEQYLNRKVRISRENKLNCSIGIAEYQYGETTEQVIQRADTALYKAKELGKGRYIVG